MRGGASGESRRPIVAGKYCAPGREGNNGRRSYTCFDKSELLELARTWNRSATGGDQKIPTRQRSKRQLWNALYRQLGGHCDTEYCWTKHPRLKTTGGKIARNSFRPSRPRAWARKPTEWLSNVDILRVLEQYEDKYDDFLFVGPVPIDFEEMKRGGTRGGTRDCVAPELCKLNLQEWWDDRVRRVGIVFNLDPHDMSGSHWVSLFADLSKGVVHYYDSYGLHAQDEIRVLIDSMVKQGSALRHRYGKPFYSTANTRRVQFKNSECGVYCVHFISQMLEGVKYKDYIANGISDKQMNTYRTVFFNPLQGKMGGGGLTVSSAARSSAARPRSLI